MANPVNENYLAKLKRASGTVPAYYRELGDLPLAEVEVQHGCFRDCPHNRTLSPEGHYVTVLFSDAAGTTVSVVLALADRFYATETGLAWYRLLGQAERHAWQDWSELTIPFTDIVGDGLFDRLYVRMVATDDNGSVAVPHGAATTSFLHSNSRISLADLFKLDGLDRMEIEEDYLDVRVFLPRHRGLYLRPNMQGNDRVLGIWGYDVEDLRAASERVLNAALTGFRVRRRDDGLVRLEPGPDVGQPEIVVDEAVAARFNNAVRERLITAAAGGGGPRGERVVRFAPDPEFIVHPANWDNE